MQPLWERQDLQGHLCAHCVVQGICCLLKLCQLTAAPYLPTGLHPSHPGSLFPRSAGVRRGSVQPAESGGGGGGGGAGDDDGDRRRRLEEALLLQMDMQKKLHEQLEVRLWGLLSWGVDAAMRSGRQGGRRMRQPCSRLEVLSLGHKYARWTGLFGLAAANQ